MKIACKVSIGRTSNGVITITVQDELSRARFLELEMTPEAFALAVTGLSLQEATGTVRGLGVVGKRRIDEERQAVYPGSLYDKRETMRAWLEANCQEEGWIVDTYLGSQSSVKHAPDGSIVLNYRVSRFVDVED